MFKKYLVYIFDFLSEHFWMLISTMFMFFSPVAELIVVALTLSVFDMFMAIVATIKNNGASSVSSTKMQGTITKILSYVSLILVLHVVDVLFVKKAGLEIVHLFSDDDSFLVKVMEKMNLTAFALFLILMREIKSIDEKWEQLFGWSFHNTINSQLFDILTKIKTFIPNEKK